MRVVLQRVSRAEVRVDGESVGRIARGYLLLAGFDANDDDDALRWMAAKLVGLRLFPDDDDRMNRSLDELEPPGAMLVVSQFTLYGDATKGRRPSFVGAAPPAQAEALYERFVEALRAVAPGAVETGRFGATMDVELVNDGPVTLILER
ncbi:MAG TPA: D-aminoacyl-tRNA deacylase [Longimicrobiales bacterium]|nr:D-aminoacyl-tRNA deacylase [Longimicrobiales bacterium]